MTSAHQWLSLSFLSSLDHSLTSVIFPLLQVLSRLNWRLPKSLLYIKNGDSHDIHNYRPISVLPCFSKILERLMYKRLYKFLSDFHIVDFQFCFRSKLSTDLALIHFVNHLNSSLTQKLSSVWVSIDLSKAFDTIDHNVILSKLDHYTVFEESLFNGLQTATCTIENNLPLSIKLTVL